MAIVEYVPWNNGCDTDHFYWSDLLTCQGLCLSCPFGVQTSSPVLSLLHCTEYCLPPVKGKISTVLLHKLWLCFTGSLGSWGDRQQAMKPRVQAPYSFGASNLLCHGFSISCLTGQIINDNILDKVNRVMVYKLRCVNLN